MVIGILRNEMEHKHTLRMEWNKTIAFTFAFLETKSLLSKQTFLEGYCRTGEQTGSHKSGVPLKYSGKTWKCTQYLI